MCSPSMLTVLGLFMALQAGGFAKESSYCPLPFVDVGMENCYLFQNNFQWRTWLDAQDYCDQISVGARLVEFDSVLEHHMVLRHAVEIKWIGNPWVGAFKNATATDAVFRWNKSGKVVDRRDFNLRRNIFRILGSGTLALSLDRQDIFNFVEESVEQLAPFICELSRQ